MTLKKQKKNPKNQNQYEFGYFFTNFKGKKTLNMNFNH
jgi:hypothetical protein